jgi:hypothetical protein
VPGELDWSKLPPELGWLVTPAEKYGRLQFDDAIYAYLRELRPAERSELQEIGRQWGEAWPAIDAWLTAYRMTTHPEARLVYFTGVLLGTGADAGLI